MQIIKFFMKWWPKLKIKPYSKLHVPQDASYNSKNTVLIFIAYVEIDGGGRGQKEKGLLITTNLSSNSTN